MRKILLYFGIVGFACLPLCADETNDEATDRPQPHTKRQTVMVVAAQSELMVGPDSQGTVRSGTLLTITQSKGSWSFVPARLGWIKSADVIPLERSEAHFTDIINREPTAEAYHHRGIAREALGHHESAMSDLDEAVKLGLEDPELYINRANVWHSLGHDENALADVNRALEAAPQSALAFNNRALIRASLGNLEEALSDVTEAIRLDPKMADAFNNRGVMRVKRGEFKEAVADYDQAIRLYPEFVQAYGNRGYAAKQLGRYTEALEDYRHAAELAPESPQAFNDAAWLLATCPEQTLRDGNGAVQYATYACELTDYKNGEFIDTLAAAQAAAGQFPQAVKTQQQAITLLPEAAQAGARERLTLYQHERPLIERPAPAE